MSGGAIPSTLRPRRWARLFHEPRHAQDFGHHATLRDADPRLLEMLCGDLARQGFRGRIRVADRERSAWLRRGPSPRLSSLLFIAGCVGLAVRVASGSGLLEELHQLLQDAGVPPSALPAGAVASSQLPAPIAFVAFGCMLLALFLAGRKRQYLQLSSRPSGHGGVDLWIGAASSAGEADITSTFAAVVDRARRPVA